MASAKVKCCLCGRLIEVGEKNLFAQAGELLAEDVWNDSGELCNQCLESRGKLAMMYLHDRNR